MTTICPRCGSPHDSEAAVVQHAWMSEDGDHEDLEDKGDAWRMVINESTDGDGSGVNVDADNDNDRSTTADNATSASTTVADGAGLGLAGPPERETVDEETLEENSEGDTYDCPNCGADTEMRPEEFVDGRQYSCTECPAQWTWRDS